MTSVAMPLEDFQTLLLSALPSLPLFTLQAAAAAGMFGAILVLTRHQGRPVRHRQTYLGLSMGLTIYIIAWFVSESMKGAVKLNLSTDLLLLSGLIGGWPGGLACYAFNTLARLHFAGTDRLLASMLDTLVPVCAGAVMHAGLYPRLRAAFRLQLVWLVWLARVVATYAGFMLGLVAADLPPGLLPQLVMLRLLVLPLSFCVIYLSLRMLYLDAQVDVQRHREQRLTRTDAMSGLPNRWALTEYLATPGREPGCLMVLELRNLRDFLLRYGPQQGSLLWAEMDNTRHALRLWQPLQSYRPHIFQYGDFSLAVVLHGVRLSALEASGEVDTFLDELKGRIVADWPRFAPRFRCGVVPLEDHATPQVLAYRNITLALSACEEGVAYFNDLLRDDSALDVQIDEALDRWRRQPYTMPMYLQPKIRLADGMLSGAEALLRMRNDKGQTIAAMRAITLFRERGRLAEFEWLSLQTVIGMLPDICRRFPGISVAVNVSTESLGRIDFVSGLCQLMARHGVPRTALRLEVVEWSDALLLPRVADTMQQLLAEGFSLSLDDFGAGYATLMLLTRFAFAEVKLDATLVADLDNQRVSHVVALAVEAAHRSGAVVVAEGIESHAMAQRVTLLGIDMAQGYLYAPALDLARFLQLPVETPLPAQH